MQELDHPLPLNGRVLFGLETGPPGRDQLFFHELELGYLLLHKAVVLLQLNLLVFDDYLRAPTLGNWPVAALGLLGLFEDLDFPQNIAVRHVHVFILQVEYQVLNVSDR